MSLLYQCDDCGYVNPGEFIRGLSSGIDDCLPNDWALCRHDPRKSVEVLCGYCYSDHRSRT